MQADGPLAWKEGTATARTQVPSTKYHVPSSKFQVPSACEAYMADSHDSSRLGSWKGRWKGDGRTVRWAPVWQQRVSTNQVERCVMLDMNLGVLTSSCATDSAFGTCQFECQRRGLGLDAEINCRP